MTNASKVLRALEKCIPGNCDVCPYNRVERPFQIGEPTRCQIQELLKDAADLIRPLAAPAQVMTLEEIEAVPDGAVLWEEVRVNMNDTDPETLESLGRARVEYQIAPVEKRGKQLVGNGIVEDITPCLLNASISGQLRYWNARPTEEQREEAPWDKGLRRKC